MFKDILGNDAIKASLIRLNAGGRVPNAMIFSGADGVGKKLFAFELARIFACSELVNGEACGACSACRRIGPIELPESTDKNKDKFARVFFGEHLDVGMAAAYKRFILVDAIRDLEAQSRYKPYEARARTFVVDDADRMNDAASNALLKTLEEPAETSRIVLVTSRPAALLPTIRSRCQTFRFAPVGRGELERYLIEKRSLDTADAGLAASVSEGSVGTALTLDLPDLRERRLRLVNVLKAAFEARDVVGLLRTSELLNEAKNKDNLEAELKMLLTLVRDAWLIAATGTHENIVHADIAADLSAIASGTDARCLARAMDEIETLRAGFAVNVNRKVGTDNLFLKMAA
ncbi:MAG: hypothetical protein IPM25_12950 [Chloracidobacterium sp.]|nr:hypothetical protein [Chloracidobacterium sp.]